MRCEKRRNSFKAGDKVERQQMHRYANYHILKGNYDDLINTRITEIITTLDKYINAEEQGLLVRLPCKLGDAFLLNNDTVYIVIGIECDHMQNKSWFIKYTDEDEDGIGYLSFDDFKAQAKLKETR